MPDEKINVDTTKLSKKEISKEYDTLIAGTPSLWEKIFPSHFSRKAESYIKVGNKFARTFLIVDYPERLQIGDLAEITGNNGRMIDTSERILPQGKSTTLKRLIHDVADTESSARLQAEKGHGKNLGELSRRSRDGSYAKASIERGYENFFEVQYTFTLYADTLKELNQETHQIKNNLPSFTIRELNLQQGKAYKSTIPIGQNYIRDGFRNFLTSGLEALFTLDDFDLSHPDGVYIGTNTFSGTPARLDTVNRSTHEATNSNGVIVGTNGAGKTSFIKILTRRSMFDNIHTFIVDVEGEYANIADNASYTGYVRLGDENNMINMFDIKEKVDIDPRTGKKSKSLSLNQKVDDVANTIALMIPQLTPAELALIQKVIKKTYEQLGIREGEVDSLFTKDQNYNNGSYVIMENQRKRMPTLTDLYNKMEELVMDKSQPEWAPLETVLPLLHPFLRDEIHGQFDTLTAPNLENFQNKMIVVFDISKLEDTNLQAVGINLALTWIWHNLVQEHPEFHTRVILDEAWMALKGDFQDDGASANMIARLSRRIRKRNGGLWLSTQRFSDFVGNSVNSVGADIASQSGFKIIMKTDTNDREDLKKYLQLNDKEINLTQNFSNGQMLIRTTGKGNTSYFVTSRYSQSELERTQPAFKNIQEN